MPNSPFTIQQPYTSTNKMFGGNIVQVPVANGSPSTPYDYAWIYENWSTTYPNWILPQLKAMAQRGFNTVRMMGGVDGVLQSNYTQSYYETCLTTLVNECRSLGLKLGMSACSLSSYSVAGTFTASQWFAPTQSALTNVYIPDQDVIAYLEVGNQETTGGDTTLSLALASMGVTATSIPILLSSYEATPTWIAGSSANLAGCHVYPNNGINDDFQSILNWVSAWRIAVGNKPVLFEECGYENVTYQAKADFFSYVLDTCFGHPDSQGVLAWGGYGLALPASDGSTDGDWTYYNPPTNVYDPSQYWSDTVTSIFLASWGPLNRNLIFNVISSGSTINGTAADLPLTGITQSVSEPTVSGLNITTPIDAVCALGLTGTISLSGNGGSSYTISFVATDTVTSTSYTIGTPLVLTGSPSGQVISMSGTLPHASTWEFNIQAQMTAGTVAATVTSLAALLSIGSAPTPPAPSSTKQFGGL